MLVSPRIVLVVVVVVASCLGQERGDTLARRRLAVTTRQRQPRHGTRIQVTADRTSGHRVIVSWFLVL